MVFLMQVRKFSLSCLLNFTRFEAGGANMNSFPFSIHHDLNPLQIRGPSAFGKVMGMGDSMSEQRFFPADLTNFSHFILLLGLLQVYEHKAIITKIFLESKGNC